MSLREIAALASLIIVLLLPIFFIWHQVFPWEDAIDELEANYPTENYFLYLGGTTKWYSKSGKVVKKKYILLPSNEIVQVKQYGNSKLELKKLSGGGLYFLGPFLIPIIYLIFFGVPTFKEKFSNKR